MPTQGATVHLLSSAVLRASKCGTPAVCTGPTQFVGSDGARKVARQVVHAAKLQRVRGNGYTSRDRAEELALLRSAELTLQNGFTHFVIVDGRSHAEYGTFTTPSVSTTTGSASLYGNTAFGSATTTTTGGQTFMIAKPSVTNTIVCFDGKPNVAALVYDAQFVFRSLAKKYEAEGVGR